VGAGPTATTSRRFGVAFVFALCPSLAFGNAGRPTGEYARLALYCVLGGVVVRRGDAPRLAGRSRHLAQQGQELPGTPARPPLRAASYVLESARSFRRRGWAGQSLGASRRPRYSFFAPGVRVCLGAHADFAPSSPLRSFVLGSFRSGGSGRVHSSVDPPTDRRRKFATYAAGVGERRGPHAHHLYAGQAGPAAAAFARRPVPA
jgi:hypothetical protein